MIRYRLLLLLSFLLIVSAVQSQTPKNFTHEPAKFLKEMEEFLALTNKKQAQELIERFEEPWNGGKFSTEQKELVFFTCDAMLKKRLKPFPDFYNYINTLIVFSGSGQSAASFKSWHTGIDKLLTGSSRNFSSYLDVCNSLFQGGVIYESNAAKWRSSNLNYTFEYDSLPKVVFPALDLVCYAKGDSSVIQKTSGTYYPTLKQFLGKQGTVYWRRAGLPESEVYATLQNYRIDVTGSDYDVDSVTFYNKQIFAQPLNGRLSEKILANTDSLSASYPRFRSYNTDLEIKELIKDASYRGGFSMHGSKMIGSGGRNKPATLSFNKNGKLFLVASSQGFIIRRDRIVTENAAVVFYFDNDSIYHPGSEFKYLYETKTLTITRPSQRTIGTPFVDSFHAIDMYFDVLTWKVGDPLMDLKMTTTEAEVKLIFESNDYFRAERYQRLQGIAEVNPLFKIKQYAEKYQLREVTVSEFASYLRMDDSQIRSLFMELSSQGFVSYNSARDAAVIKDKLYFYISASVGKTDYDILEFGSQISGKPNATINLLNYNIDMRGVARVSLSDTQRVYVFPNEQELTLMKNRDFTFNGKVRAGRFDYVGKEFSFNYTDFKIHLKTIDSLMMRIPGPEPLPDGRIPLVAVKSVIQNMTGYLEIDRPDNKSSVKKSPEFPRFKSDQPSYVYYDYPEIYGGVYKRDRFYFKLDPFEIDSLDNFDPSGLNFDGTFVSAGIFPDMRERLVLQQDNSLGFKKELDDAGSPVYAGKGRYFEKIKLDNSGLTGGGKLDYLASTSRSKSFIFFPDSTNATGLTFDQVRKDIDGVQYPQANGSDITMNWRPGEDKMMLFKNSVDFTMYGGQVDHNGDLTIAKTGTTGRGALAFDKAGLTSSLYKFKGMTFSADTSDFSLRSKEEGRPALSTTNMKSFVDLDKRFGEFTTNGPGSYVTFPFNKYICFIDKFKWLMDEQNVEFVKQDMTAAGSRMGIAGAEFISIDPAQDSLRWFSGEAIYSLADYVLRANGVKEIKVADAVVYPGDQKVVIGTDAYMRQLANAKVVADTSLKYHTITDATIRITSRKDYNGNGNYEYVDQLSVKHLLSLTHIGVDTSMHSFANGEIPDSMNFLLSPNIQYKGAMTIRAMSQGPFFKGFARANHSCKELGNHWFSFASEINPKGVNVPVKDPANEDGQRLYSGIHFARDSAGVYGTFISPRKSDSDLAIFEAEGLLSFNSESREFRIAPAPPEPVQSKGRKQEDTAADSSRNSFVLNDANCSFKGFGSIELGENLGQLKLNTFGEAVFDPAADSLYFDAIADMDFLFSNDALKAMAELILSFPTIPPTNDARPVFRNGMEVILGKQKSSKFLEEIDLYGNPRKIPDELQHSIVLTDLKLYWNKELMSYRSVGPIGVGYLGKIPVNRMVKGYFEIIRRRSGDVFNLFLELDGINWFYFNYQRGVLQVISSDIRFNDIINNMKPEKRVADEKGGKPPFQYLISTERKKLEFIRRIENRD